MYIYTYSYIQIHLCKILFSDGFALGPNDDTIGLGLIDARVQEHSPASLSHDKIVYSVCFLIACVTHVDESAKRHVQ